MTMEPIELETKTDRELLLIVTARSNQIVDHLARLNGSLQCAQTDIKGCRGDIEALQGDSALLKQKIGKRVNWQTTSWVATVVALIIITLSDKLKWW